MKNKGLIAKILLWCVVFVAAAGSCLWVVFADGNTVETLSPFQPTNSEVNEAVPAVGDEEGEKPTPPKAPDPKDGPLADEKGPAEKPDPKKDGPKAEGGPLAQKEEPLQVDTVKASTGPAAKAEAPIGPASAKEPATSPAKVETAKPQPVIDEKGPVEKAEPTAKKAPAPAAKPEPAKQPAEPASKPQGLKDTLGPAAGTPGGVGTTDAVKVDSPTSPVPSKGLA